MNRVTRHLTETFFKPKTDCFRCDNRSLQSSIPSITLSVFGQGVTSVAIDQYCNPYFFILLYSVTRLMPSSFAVFVRLKLFLNNVCSMISFSFSAT